jgi:diguanylate cyclase (GGDEF)-like protein
MKRLRLGIGPRGWRIVIAATLLGTLACVLVSLAFNYILIRTLGGAWLEQTMLGATIVPVILTAPLFFVGTARLCRLTRINRRLDAAARTDALTACLNRGAFTRSAAYHLRHPKTLPAHGALLMIDADHFKSINDRFGHDQGDIALALLARAIRSAVRSNDIVGRLGGEEFGVFLPMATGRAAESAARRIHAAVAASGFAPRGEPHALSVSIGGLVFGRAIGFAELYRLADRNLYEAKHAGRGLTMISELAERPLRPEPAAALR